MTNNKNDHSAGLIHQPIPTIAETEPRLSDAVNSADFSRVLPLVLRMTNGEREAFVMALTALSDRKRRDGLDWHSKALDSYYESIGRAVAATIIAMRRTS